MSIFTKAFWVYAAERAVKTVAQGAVAAIGTSALGIIGLDWKSIVSVSALAGLVSVLTSLIAFTDRASAPAELAPSSSKKSEL